MRDHVPLRTSVKLVEKFPCMLLIKNGKFFIPPERSDEDFKELFARVAAAGVGRPVDKDGVPQGPWTPDLLADAISAIDANRAGIELRTVQLWFEDNEKGISATNIRWLARVLGCNDPKATSAWQTALSAAQSRLAAKRRTRRRQDLSVEPEQVEVSTGSADLEEPQVENPPRRFDLAGFTEALFSRGSLLSLPAVVFAGAVALQFLSYFLSIHSFTYVREDGVMKQVGFLWALNWTVLFVLLLPLGLAIVADLLAKWKNVSRPSLVAGFEDGARIATWSKRVAASGYTYWTVFLICVGFAGLFQWISVRLLPMLNGAGDQAMDWGSIALVQPEQIGIFEQTAFTGIAYLYMCLCFYLFFAAMILCSNMIDDVVAIRTVLATSGETDRSNELNASAHEILRGIFRYTALGLLIATCMKIESLYRLTSASSVWAWLSADAQAAFGLQSAPISWASSPGLTHYTSLLVAFLAIAIYLYGKIRLGALMPANRKTVRPGLAIAVLFTAYVLAGGVPGFSILVFAGSIVALLGLFDPEFRFRARQTGRSHYAP